VNKSIQLQALRGLAVSLVVLYHMGYSAFHNGWIGVDIFFVISGFLMWQLYRNSILEGNIKYFYIRRFTRLLPALSFLLVISNIIFFFRFLPYERRLLAMETVAANFFVSNFNYWMGDQYFSNGSLRPLLNLWSISLEIQFYLLFPLVVYFVKSSKARFLFLLTISFLSYLALSLISPQTSFFLLPGRLWEFMMGMLAGILLRQKFTRRPNFTLLLMISSIALGLALGVPLNKPQTIIFQVTTVLVFSLLIWIAWSDFKGNHLLAILGKLGDYSYSIYLIHFPLIVLIGYQPFLGNPNGIGGIHDYLLFCSVLILFSWLSKRYVEDSKFYKKNFVAVFGVSVVVSITALSLQPVISSLGYSKEELVISNASRDRGEFRCGLLLRLPFLNAPSKTCLLPGSPKNLERVLLVGNSHANAIKEAVVKALPTKSVYLINENNAVSLQNLETFKKAILKLQPKTIIMHSRAGNNSKNVIEPFIEFAKEQMIRVVIIEPVPIPGFDVPSKALSLLGDDKSIDALADRNFRIETYNSSNKNELGFLSQLESAKKIIRVPVADLFCNPYCQIVDLESLKPLYFDSGHVTKTGASKLIPRIKSALGE
jgi:peptidoglycan/LPS O-acetylase OafA/YrhL